MKKLVTILFLAGAVLVPICFSGDQTHNARPMSADQLQWGPAPNAFPAGAQMAVLDGDPTKGAFVVRVKTPDGYVIPPHWHPALERVTVISGKVKLGMGDKFQESQMQTLGPGGFVSLPAEHSHYVKSSGESIIQVQSDSAFQITYVNPKDDPRHGGSHGK